VTLPLFTTLPAPVQPDHGEGEERIFNSLRTEIQKLTGQKRRLEKRMGRVEYAAIRVEREVYSGVRIRIGEKALLLEEDTENVTFRMEEDGIVY
jgi:uncharacterized protein (DUF342 family)